MEQIYSTKMQELGYDQLVCDIFANWEDVKDEILIPERKTGSGNGTVHIFLGAANDALQAEFPNYYESVKTEADAANGAFEVTHYFLRSNIISMLGYVCQYNYNNQKEIGKQVGNILDNLNSISSSKILSTKSLFKLSTGSNKLRPYFKQFESNGVFSKVIRKILLPESSYKISLYKNSNGKYAAFWLIGFDDFTDFEADANINNIKETDQKETEKSRQIIFYGAPGTGKSNSIDKQTNESNRIRTTFHPDSDYSTFVGAYKPTMKKLPRYNPNSGAQMGEEEKITYSFVPQAFLKAYVEAWKRKSEGNDEPFYLVIEEINRGNCAQIFGDLFQLLDRDVDGQSKYAICPDDDIKRFLLEAFAESNNLPKEIKKGDEMRLPSNLYIWATMNTSDQSLFPIDSAFKRRWDWEYMPIADAGKGHVIEIGDKLYDWWTFVSIINEKIGKITSSEDKKLGYWFIIPANGGKEISSKQFVSKVLFYLWNDVYKDYAESSENIFKTIDDEGKEKNAPFTSFFGSDVEERLQGFMAYNKIKAIGEEVAE